MPVPGSAIGENPCRLLAAFFLNCTKNTELTRGHFARTFSLALTKIQLAVQSLKAKRGGASVAERHNHRITT
jgi:hypothetical protein